MDKQSILYTLIMSLFFINILMYSIVGYGNRNGGFASIYKNRMDAINAYYLMFNLPLIIVISLIMSME